MTIIFLGFLVTLILGIQQRPLTTLNYIERNPNSHSLEKNILITLTMTDNIYLL